MPSRSEPIILTGRQMEDRTFLLGNEGGFVLYQPVQLNTRDRTLQASKWFGASGFGLHFLSACRLWIVLEGKQIALDCSNQIEFRQEYDRAVRTHRIDGHTVQQTMFVPNRIQAAVLSIESDSDLAFIAEPQFDMRYYQTFNTDFSGYRVSTQHCDAGSDLRVSNHIQGPNPTLPDLDFFSLIQAVSGDLTVEILPEEQRLRKKTYLVDEHRAKVIQGAYLETQDHSPDEAPIWDQYSTQIYAPAHLHGVTPMDLVFVFAGEEKGSEERAHTVRRNLSALRRRKSEDVERRLEQGRLTTGVEKVDTAYNQVLTRFNNCLVARDMRLHRGTDLHTEHFNAIFAGNKYFLDAWKRDENISLAGLLVTGDYPTMRAILNDTWQFQDPRTGRLPHIIRLGEPLVYYSSDGTLWALRRLYQYGRATADLTLLDDKYPMVEHFFEASLNFVKRGLLPSGGIIDSTYRWETWEDTPYTPRDGYPVEIELLWLTALANYLPVIAARNSALAARLKATLDEGRETFKRFHLDGYLADSLSYDWEPRTILTPNGYMAFELEYPLPPELARQMVMLGRDQLAGHTGIRSLAPRDWAAVLSPDFVADPKQVQGKNMASVGIYNYHRGVEWLWLNQFFVAGELAYGDADHAFDRYVHGLVHEALHEGGIGGLSELYDLHGSLGADFQAWSMAGFVGALHAFAGISLDAINSTVSLRPAIPEDWPALACRRQVGETRFDLSYRREEGKAQVLEVRSVDPVPDNFRLSLGVRVGDAGAEVRVTLNGNTVPDHAVRRHGGDGVTPAEIWVETAFEREVSARFEVSG